MNKEHPILFTGEMVRAIFEGRKKQTRRVVKPQPYKDDYSKPTLKDGLWAFPSEVRYPMITSCPYGVFGDRLWARETLKTHNDERMTYSADGESRYPESDDERAWIWKRKTNSTISSIHMPKWATRLWLEITGIRVERVQEINHKDALSEGCYDFVVESDSKYYNDHEFTVNAPNGDIHRQTALIAFRELWDSINAKRGYGWESNPWVWVIEFKKGARNGKVQKETGSCGGCRSMVRGR